jgi:DNA-directed RNA polymerase specialized sigma24 family protein
MAQKHYVDNKKLFEVMVKHRNLMIKYKKAQKKTKRKLKVPPIPEYIGECLLMIATRLSNKPNFANYTFREDMISDAIENCILYMHNFDPKKSQNPFAYFTQIIHYAFIRRIEREKKYSYTKYKYALHKAHQKEDYTVDANESFDIKDPAWASYENVHDFIRTYEDKLARNRAAKASDDTDEDIVSFDILEEESDGELAVDGQAESVDVYDAEDEE